MSSQQVESLDDLTHGPYFIFLNYKDARGCMQTKRRKFSDVRDGPRLEQECLDEISQEGGEPSGIDIADSDGHFYRTRY